MAMDLVTVLSTSNSCFNLELRHMLKHGGGGGGSSLITTHIGRDWDGSRRSLSSSVGARETTLEEPVVVYE